MSGDYFYTFGRVKPKISGARPGPPPAPVGTLTTGRIVKIARGHGTGFIRLCNDREVYFHRGDVRDPTSFHDLEVGQTVSFELLDDRVSGPRALRLTRPTKP